MYEEIHQFEPLLPQKNLEPIRDLSRSIVQGSVKLAAQTHAGTREKMRELVREMNSYYSNRIEGQGTHPKSIERALRKEFSNEPDVARLQRIAVAHIEAEKSLEVRVAAGANPLTSSFAIEAHEDLYGRLSQKDRTTDEGVVIEPGKLRQADVEVEHHIPPSWKAVPQFLNRFDEVYSRKKNWDDMLIALASAHQRLAWIHPFLDGNGRATRLQSHCALWPISEGLWSVNRGLARQRDEYYLRLANADQPRKGDLDGRGNLSESELWIWVEYFLNVCVDQLSFMSTMFDLGAMKRRIEALIVFRATEDKAIRREAILPLFHLFAAGDLSRGEFQQMTGLGERVARSLLSRLIATDLVTSDSPYGSLRFGMPLDALQFLFPGLYPEVDVRER